MRMAFHHNAVQINQNTEYVRYYNIMCGVRVWSDTSWQGPFYPTSIENSGWLKYYSNIFDCVEIDSSLYIIPTPFMVKNSIKITPIVPMSL